MQPKNVIDDGKFASGVFLDFQKALDAVNYQILISKLEHYGVRGVPLNLFESYLENRKQFISVNNVNSDIFPIEYVVTQSSVLGPLPFLIYINDLNNAVEVAVVHPFANDTNVLHLTKFLKDINRKINFDLKKIVMWLRGNKIPLNEDQTELVLFRSKIRKITKTMNFRISGQKIKMLSKIKYLGLLLDGNLSFKYDLDTIKLKLNKANCLLSKIRYFVRAPLLRAI